MAGFVYRLAADLVAVAVVLISTEGRPGVE
jgi:hypothetical protein